ncbi:MAG: 3-oxoacyl-ACP synthase III [Thermoanaerobaculales bacterium]
MNFENVSILSVAHLDAPNRVSSEGIERRLAPTMQRLGVRPDLLRDLSGIMERRYWDEGVMPSEAATKAGEKALNAAEIDRSKVGILINTSVCRDYLEPSTACIVHHRLGLSETCMNFDLGNACLGFVNGMDMVGNMIDRGQVDYAILVDGETSRQITETTIGFLTDGEVDEATFRENFASLTLGSGAAAMVLGRSDLAPEGHPFRGSVNLAATQHCDLCAGNIDHMVTRTKELLVAGMELALRTWEHATKVLGWTADAIDHFVFHQVSKVHTEQFAGLLGIDLRKVFRVYPDFGNIGPASVPIVLSKLQELGRLQRGQRIALVGIGSGLNCSMAEVEW